VENKYTKYRLQRARTLTEISKEGEFNCAKCCSKAKCSKRLKKFADEFVLVFGGEEALKERKKDRKRGLGELASSMDGSASYAP